jgi:hypothetical protein
MVARVTRLDAVIPQALDQGLLFVQARPKLAFPQEKGCLVEAA